MSDCYWGITDTYVYNIREMLIIKVVDNHDDRVTRKRRNVFSGMGHTAN